MPLAQSEAIILRTFNIGEQDRLVVLFTRDFGLIKGVAKGARKFKSRFGSSLEPMSLVNAFYYEKESRELVTISNCDLRESFFEIQADFDVSVGLSYFAELCQEFFPARAKDDRLFRLLLACLRALKAGADFNFVGAYFEAWFLNICGVMPDFRTCRKCRKPAPRGGWLNARRDGLMCPRCARERREAVCPELSPFLDWSRKNPPGGGPGSPFPPPQIANIRKTFRVIVLHHMEKIPRSIATLNPSHHPPKSPKKPSGNPKG